MIWNTAHGHFFQTSFESYSFLGVHFQPVLLFFAALYRLGFGIESLLIVQALFAGAAAVPLFYAVRRFTDSSVAALFMAAAFLLTSSLHHALDFDFHPEMMGFFFAFLALYYLAAGRPQATVIALLPLLALKEDMPLILAAFAALLLVEGHRRHARTLFLIAVGWTVAVAFVAMPLIRWGDAGLSTRYVYLIKGSSAATLVPHIVGRGLSHLQAALVISLPKLAPGLFLAVLSPVAALVLVPPLVFHGLSGHDSQAHLDLHYVMMPLALTFVAAALGLRNLSRAEGVALLPPLGRFAPDPRGRRRAGDAGDHRRRLLDIQPLLAGRRALRGPAMRTSQS